MVETSTTNTGLYNDGQWISSALPNNMLYSQITVGGLTDNWNDFGFAEKSGCNAEPCLNNRVPFFLHVFLHFPHPNKPLLFHQ